MCLLGDCWYCVIFIVLLWCLVKCVINFFSYLVLRLYCLGWVSIVLLLEWWMILIVCFIVYYCGGMYLVFLCVRYFLKIFVIELVLLYFIRKCVKWLCVIVLFWVSCCVFFSVLGICVFLSFLVMSCVCWLCCFVCCVRNLYISGWVILIFSLIIWILWFF